MRRTSLDLRYLPATWQRQGWDRLLREWATLLDLYDTTEDGQRDVAYWYGERALTGLLAPAAWRLQRPQGWSLEEFADPRARGIRARAGRGDLWLGLGRHKFTIEAKVTWPPKMSTVAVDEANLALKRATDQLTQLSKRFCYGKLLALCYVVPVVSRRTSSHRQIAQLRQLARRLRQGNDFVAIYHPHSPAQEDGHHQEYPGAILTGRAVYRD
jgi:hypothetical protein